MRNGSSQIASLVLALCGCAAESLPYGEWEGQVTMPPGLLGGSAEPGRVSLVLNADLSGFFALGAQGHEKPTWFTYSIRKLEARNQGVLFITETPGVISPPESVHPEWDLVYSLRDGSLVIPMGTIEWVLKRR